MRTVLLLALFPLTAAAADYSPDPLSVRRHGPAYRYPQAGWTVLHIEGKPYDRGVQHGTLMATEIAAYVRCFAALQSPKDPAGGWAHVRRLTRSLFQPKFHREFLEEMRGIADGAAEAGAAFDGKPIDLTDIVALNCWAEIESLDAGLDALPTGLERLPGPSAKTKNPAVAKPEHCSAFAAVGPATADGKVVIGHITMFGLYPSRFYNLWLDVQPESGHRVLMQSYPGGIQSGMDYYLTSAGLVLAETTIEQTRFRPDGVPLTSRVRKAVQYSDSIDDVVKALTESNNGLYTNEWLIADTKANEIALFELGTSASRLRRSSKEEWFGGTPGFYWGCNNGKDAKVRLEAVADPANGRAEAVAWVPGPRDRAWLEFYARHKGKITAETGRLALSSPPLCGAASLDAKVTTTESVKGLRTHAVFGPPTGGTWSPTDTEKADFPEIVPLVPNDWTVLQPDAPPKGKAEKVADLPHKSQAFRSPADRLAPTLPTTKPAWHGALLAKDTAALPAVTAFAAFERIVALDRHFVDAGEHSDADRERVQVEFGIHRSDVLRWAAVRPAAKGDVPDERWLRSTAGRLVLQLHVLRMQVGTAKFTGWMEEFGQAHAGRAISADDLATFLKAKGVDALPSDSAEGFREAVSGPRYTVLSWHDELDRTTIVYGTLAEAEANRETAEELQKAIARRGSHVRLPVVSDVEAERDGARKKHLLLVGRPGTNRLSDTCRKSFPAAFGAGSFRVRDEVFAHPGSAVVAAGVSPSDPDSSVVLIAGLSAEATRFAVPFLLDKDLRPGNVLLLPNQAQARSLLVK